MKLWVVLDNAGMLAEGFDAPFEGNTKEAAEKEVVDTHYPLVVQHTPALGRDPGWLLLGYGLYVVPITPKLDHLLRQRGAR